MAFSLSFGKEFVRKHGIGISIKDDELPDIKAIIESQDYKELKKNVYRVREELSLANQVHRLEEFYTMVHDMKKT